MTLLNAAPIDLLETICLRTKANGAKSMRSRLHLCAHNAKANINSAAFANHLAHTIDPDGEIVLR